MEFANKIKVFANNDFGYYKVTVERPQRLAAQFTPQRVRSLRAITYLEEIVDWAYERWGPEIIDTLKARRKELEAYAEEIDLSLTSSKKRKLFDSKAWRSQYRLMQVGERLMAEIGQDVYRDFNQFSALVEQTLKRLKIKLSASEKRQLLAAVSWYDADAAKVIKKTHRLSGKKLARLLDHLGCTEADLPDFGYWPTQTAGVYQEFETETSLRDTENVPLPSGKKASDTQAAITAIHDYFLAEVRPYVAEAWLDLDRTRIGYEISFNKYFYRHTPLRSLAEVTRDILALEAETEGLLKRLVRFGEGVG